ncbi:MAG: diguanylate cyclase domain-containing protein [Kiloniellaceae bacterium]
MTIDADLLIRAFEATSHAVMITDAEGTILAVNGAFTEVTGWPAEEAVGRTPRILASGRQDADFYEAMWTALLRDGRWRGELWNRRRTGEVHPEYLTIDAIRAADGAIAHFVAVFSDMAERKTREARLSTPACQDEVTSLPNRALFLDRLERAVSLARRRDGQLAVLVIDLDGFKAVNDAFGHESGDLLLKAAGARLKGCLRESDTVARWGGDEFAVVLPLVEGAKGAREAALHLLAALRRPFYMAGDEITIGASVGGALFPADGASAGALVKHADLARYEVKRRGKGGLALHGDSGLAEPPRRQAV